MASREIGEQGCSHAIHAARVLDLLAVSLEVGGPPAFVAHLARSHARMERASARPPLLSAEVEDTAALLNTADASVWAVLGIRADGA